MKSYKILALVFGCLALVSIIALLVVLALQETPIDPTIDMFPNENSVFSGKVFENALTKLEGENIETDTLVGEVVFNQKVDGEAENSYSMVIYKNGDAHDLYLQAPGVEEALLVSAGFDAEGDPMIYRYVIDGQEVYVAHVPETEGTNIYVICGGLLVMQCADYDLHDVDLDDHPEMVVYVATEDGEDLFLLDFTKDGAFVCDVAKVTGTTIVGFYYRARISFFECRNPGEYPAFYSLRDGKLVERERQLAVYEDYLYPNSSTEKLSYSDLYRMYSSTVVYAYNEIAARHGCVFEDSEFDSYFNTTRWYKPMEGFSEADLTAVELYNTITMRSYMNNVNANAYNSNADYSKADLDGDGVMESLSVVDGKLYINGESVEIFGGMNYLYFHVVDVNMEMPGFQVAVVGYNLDGRFVVEIFEYNKGKPVSAGVIAGYNDISFPGNGHIAAKMPCGLLHEDIMQDITETYTLKDGELLPDKVDAYYLVQMLETSKALTLYDSMSTKGETVQVAANTEVVILATDRVNWLFFQAETGESGWLYCEDGKVDGVDIHELFYDLIGGY